MQRLYKVRPSWLTNATVASRSHLLSQILVYLVYTCMHTFMCSSIYKVSFSLSKFSQMFKVCKPLSNLEADSLYKACISFAHFKLKTSNTPKANPTLCQCYLGGLHLLMLQSKSWHDQLSLCKPCQRRPHPPFPLDLGIAGSL